MCVIFYFFIISFFSLIYAINLPNYIFAFQGFANNDYYVKLILAAD